MREKNFVVFENLKIDQENKPWELKYLKEFGTILKLTCL
jgi:hypothetical protein